MFRKSLIISLSVILLASLTLITARAYALDEPVHIRCTSMPIGSSWYVQAATIAKILRGKLPPKSTIDVLPHGGGIGSAPMIAKGDAEFGLHFNMSSRWAREGKVAYKEPMTNLRGLAGGVDSFYQAIVVNRDVDISSLKELKEKKLSVRLFTTRPFGAGKFGAGLVLDAYGMSFDDIKSWGGRVEHTTFTAIIAAFKDRRADIFMHSISKGHPATTEIAVSAPVKFLSVEPEIIEVMKGYGYTESVLPKGSFKGQDNDARLPGLKTNVITNTDMSEELAYLITKTICENKEELVKGHRAFASFVPENAWKEEYLGMPLHAGAEKYYRERGWLK
jgi:TRAP transporter TAXI family solute receptor